MSAVYKPSRTGARRSYGIAGIVVIAYALVALLPLVWTMLSSFAPPGVAGSNPLTAISAFDIDAYRQVFGAAGFSAREPYTTLGGPFFNSVFVSIASTCLTMVVGTPAAYGFSRFQVPMKRGILFFVLATRLLPPVALAIPLFLLYRLAGLTDTLPGLILVYAAMNLPLAIWLLKRVFDDIPPRQEDAAMTEGYTRGQAFRRIVLPQALSGLAVAGSLCFVFAWNEFAYAVLLAGDALQTVPAALTSNRDIAMWPAVAAATTLFVLPVLAITVLVRKRLARGLTFGALR